jgi:hypothetical protein
MVKIGRKKNQPKLGTVGSLFLLSFSRLFHPFGLGCRVGLFCTLLHPVLFRHFLEKSLGSFNVMLIGNRIDVCNLLECESIMNCLLGGVDLLGDGFGATDFW